jgi:hypothetical protein
VGRREAQATSRLRHPDPGQEPRTIEWIDPEDRRPGGAIDLLAARFARHALDGIRWAEADSAKILSDAASDLVLKQAGRSSELQPLDLLEHEELQQLVASIDAGDLLAQT